MKKRNLILIALAFSCTAHVVSAGPMGGSNMGRDYLITTGELANWRSGMSYESGDRDVRVRGLDTVMASRKAMLYLGYELLPWCVPYVTGGSTETSFPGGADGDKESEYGIGLQFNLLEHDILDPLLMEDKLRVNASCQYSASKASWDGRDLRWRELFASVTVSVVNDLRGSKFFVPESIALFAGPIFSYIDSSSISDTEGALKADEKLGITGGIEIFLTKRISLDAAVKRYNAESYSAGLHIRF